MILQQKQIVLCVVVVVVLCRQQSIGADKRTIEAFTLLYFLIGGAVSRGAVLFSSYQDCCQDLDHTLRY